MFLKLGQLFFRYPVAFLRNLNGKNILKFFIALSSEPKSQIGKNVEFFLKGHQGSVRQIESVSLSSQIDHFILEVARLKSECDGEIVLFVSHEATLTGAPLIIKQIATDFQENFQIIPIFILLKGGRISGAFSGKFPTFQLADQYNESFKLKCIRELLARLDSDFRISVAYVNSAESRFVLPVLKKAGIAPIIMLVHEMGNLYRKNSWNIIDAHADYIVFPCRYVMERALENNVLNFDKVRIKGQGLLKPEMLEADRLKCRKYVRRRLGLSGKSKIVLACGTPIPRKGIDIFVLTAISVLSKWKETEPLYFVWLGDAPENAYQLWSRRDIEYSNYADNILLLDTVDDTIPWFMGSDLFFLTSRGDPFPCVIHEALSAGLQIVGFNNTGGLKEMLPPEAELLNEYGDVGAACETIINALQKDNVEVRNSIVSYSKTHLNFLEYSMFLYSLPMQEGQLSDSAYLNGDSQRQMLSMTGQVSGRDNVISWSIDTDVQHLAANQLESRSREVARDAVALPQDSDVDTLMKCLFPAGLDGKSFLDVGCGSGEYSIGAHRNGAEYVLGLDVNEQSLTQAESLKIHHQIKSYEVEFRLSDIYNVNDLVQEFDITSIRGLFEYAAFPLKVLTDLCSITGHSIILELEIGKQDPSSSLQLSMQNPEVLSDGPGSVRWQLTDVALLERIFFWNGFRYAKLWFLEEGAESNSIRIFVSRRRHFADQEDLWPKYRNILRSRIREELPVPPPSLMYYGESEERHLTHGKAEVENIKISLEKAGYRFSDQRTILEFGCNNCRLLRWFYEGHNKELWGCDIDKDMITWCSDKLGHVINLQLNDHDPPLDLADNYFDFVFAGSVFTHIDKNAQQWIDELVRVTKPGGLLYLTYLDENSMRILVNEQHRPTFKRITNYIPNAQHIWSGDFDRICIPGVDGTTDRAQGLIICHSDYIKRLTGKDLELVQITKKAYAGYQTAYLFKKI